MWQPEVEGLALVTKYLQHLKRSLVKEDEVHFCNGNPLVTDSSGRLANWTQIPASSSYYYAVPQYMTEGQKYRQAENRHDMQCTRPQ